MIGELVAETGARRAEFGRRNKIYDEETFEKPLRQAREAERWIVQRENKSTYRMRRPKGFDENLENRFWSILYRFGYPELNSGRKFKIVVGKGADATEKQIDVFAKDDETVIVAECKACEFPTKRSLLKDINEFNGLKKGISDAIRSHYGSDFKPKIIWCFVTQNIRWSNEDLRRAREHNIHVIKDMELLYFEEFSKKIGTAARFQFHAEYLAGQKVPALSGRKVPAIKTKLGGKTAYLFSALTKDVLRIAFVNHRDLRDAASAPSYQRIVKPARLRQIGEFLDEKGFFPNTILLNFHKSPLFEQKAKDEDSGVAFGSLILPDQYKSCWVIDGQHRLYGTAFTSSEYKVPLFFVGFDKVSASEEANIFVEINAKQATVPATLLSALDGEVKWDSDDPKERLSAIASRAVDLLNTSGGGPLEGKVVSPGITPGSSQPLNLRSLQQRITMSGLIGVVDSKGGTILPGPCSASTSEQTLERVFRLLEMHFDAIRDCNPVRWEAGAASALCTNLGVGSHTRLLSELIRYISFRDHLQPSTYEVEEIYLIIKPLMNKLFDYIKNSEEQEFFDRFKSVVLGSTGYHQYFFKLFAILEADVPSLRPEGYDEYRAMTSRELIEAADRSLKWVQTVVPALIKEKLRERLGEDWFEQVVNREIQKACQNRRIDSAPEDKLPPEGYLDWIHYVDIVKHKEVREELKGALSIRLPDDQAGKHFYVGWFDAINRMRRIPAHPSGRTYKPADIDALNFIVEHLQAHLPEHLSERMSDASIS
jgi:DNA sulfur modification protein DndB